MLNFVMNGHGIFKNSHVILRGIGCTIFFNKLKPFGHRHRLDVFYMMSMGNMHQNCRCLGDFNLGMCIKTYDHNSYGFQAKKKKNTHSFMNYSHTTYKSHDTYCFMKLSNTISKSYVFNN